MNQTAEQTATDIKRLTIRAARAAEQARSDARSLEQFPRAVLTQSRALEAAEQAESAAAAALEAAALEDLAALEAATEQAESAAREAEAQACSRAPILKTDKYIANLLRWYNIADSAQRSAGRAWYPAANKTARSLAARFDVTIEQAAAVIAVLSPRVSWRLNVLAAESILADITAGVAERAAVLQTPGGLQKNRVKACKIAADRHAIPDYLRGPKVNAFFDQILAAGQTDSACIDIWMIRAACNDLRINISGSLPKKHYKDLADALKQAAALAGLPVAVFQAIVWLACRAAEKTENELKNLG